VSIYRRRPIDTDGPRLLSRRSSASSFALLPTTATLLAPLIFPPPPPPRRGSRRRTPCNEPSTNAGAVRQASTQRLTCCLHRGGGCGVSPRVRRFSNSLRRYFREPDRSGTNLAPRVDPRGGRSSAFRSASEKRPESQMPEFAPLRISLNRDFGNAGAASARSICLSEYRILSRDVRRSTLRRELFVWPKLSRKAAAHKRKARHRSARACVRVCV